MTTDLAQNIRALRKERALTQEQLAEVLGVTTGAVYKWEARLSLPELGTLMELADFFDTSVDALLGYTLKNNSLRATVERLKADRREKNRAGFSDAEKALKKYPNHFEIVHASALIYLLFGMEDGNADWLRRALVLLRQAMPLIAQNTDPKISEATLCGDMAQAMYSLGQTRQAVALLQTNNAAGMYNDRIGLTLAADCGQPDEALPILSDALLSCVASLVRIVTGYLNVYLDRADYAAAQTLLRWGIDALDGLRRRPCFLDKINCTLLVTLCYTHLKCGEAEAARAAMERAAAMAKRFDAAPDYRADALHFVEGTPLPGVYDDLGTTAADGIQKTIAALEDAALAALWKDVTAHG